MAGTGREVKLNPDERIDDLERNGYGIIQKKDGFCFGMDAVLLSGFAEVRKGEEAVDLGTGTGIIPILLSAKTVGKHFYGVEVQEAVAEMAARSVRLNGLEEKIDILRGDLCRILEKGSNVQFPRAEAAGGEGAWQGQSEKALQTKKEAIRKGQTAELRQQDRAAAPGDRTDSVLLTAGQFSVVTSNPPYMKAAHGLKNPGEMKAISRHELLCTLEDVCAAAGKLLKSGGRFYLVHRPQRISEIFDALKKNRLEPKRMKFVHPFLEKEANMVLIEAVKDAKTQCRIEKPVIVYQAPGKYTDEIYEIYGY